jgi:inward rectifier potassium channel
MTERSIFNRRRSVQQQNKEMGFGVTDVRQNRLLNPDGSYNYVRIGLPFFKTFNVYHFLVTASWVRFLLIIFLWYSIVNLFFVGLYYAFGSDGLAGMLYHTEIEKFWEVYFFSAQTLTTVGYGRLNPMSFSASAIASLEALVGLLSFALITGLLFARFAKSPATLLFSEKAIFAPFNWQNNTITALMFRTVNPYRTNIMNLNAKITCSILEPNENGDWVRKFYPLNLERDTITFFPSSWTIVHPIDDNSPLYGLDWGGVQKAAPELLILLNGFDETFDQNVFIRYSYNVEEMVWGGKFVKIFNFDAEGQATIDVGRLSEFDVVDIDLYLPNTIDENIENKSE